MLDLVLWLAVNHQSFIKCTKRIKISHCQKTQKAWYDSDIPDKLNIICPEMEWHVFNIFQLLFDYRNDNPYDWQKEAIAQLNQ